jgi:hypothetical protein
LTNLFDRNIGVLIRQVSPRVGPAKRGKMGEVGHLEEVSSPNLWVRARLDEAGIPYKLNETTDPRGKATFAERASALNKNFRVGVDFPDLWRSVDSAKVSWR